MSNFLDDQELGDATFPPSPEDLFSIFEALESLKEAATTVAEEQESEPMGNVSSSSCQFENEVEIYNNGDGEVEPKRKKAKIRVEEDGEIKGNNVGGGEEGSGISRMSHITVERNRRKQMNHHLSILRSLMPCFYVKRGDQASIIGGVVDYINELQQVLQSLEAKKQRKSYSHDVLSPRLVTSPRLMSPTVHSPRKPPLSPRLNIPLSPRTPQPGSPYIPRLTNLSPTMATPSDLSPTTSSSNSPQLVVVNDSFANELVANSKSPVAEVEIKFSGSNLLLKTVSPRIPGQVVKLIAAIEKLCLEILEISIRTIEDTMLNSFTIKIGIECQLSAQELAQHIQQTFCSSTPLLI